MHKSLRQMNPIDSLQPFVTTATIFSAVLYLRATIFLEKSLQLQL